jgi:hypothetical protein
MSATAAARGQDRTSRISELLGAFKLPTAAAEMVPRMTAAGHADALPALLEVLDLEAEARRHRRVERLCRASHLPPGKTFATFDVTPE